MTETSLFKKYMQKMRRDPEQSAILHLSKAVLKNSVIRADLADGEAGRIEVDEYMTDLQSLLVRSGIWDAPSNPGSEKKRRPQPPHGFGESGATSNPAKRRRR